ncbi:cation transporter [Halobacteriovorax sp. DA5]|uniref:cation transporter n=1 Tax=Halobacteriovorax sp. DA5 TaxID=2067553 RepID=UPI000CD1C542|nr:cation transporter [Halobacteriovorax sp. DA5]POB13633.1 cobalt transporter [Halobacteriovorax sp. DA5]
MQKTSVNIKRMDCPSEIKMIEGLMENLDPSAKMVFDLESRTVQFYHSVDKDQILDSLKAISLPGDLISSQEVLDHDIPDIAPSVEAKTLKYLLGINFTMFVVEIILGFYAESTGLLADGLDMLADSFVYGISLYAVGKSIAMKHKAAYFSGIMQISLGLLCLVEVGRKFYFGSEPLSNYMIVVSVIALIANLWCLILIHKHKDGEVHMKASWIFSANDVIVNTGVIFSGVLVYFLKSNVPDLVIGGIVSLVVIKGGISIIKLSKIKKAEPIKESCCSSNCD